MSDNDQYLITQINTTGRWEDYVRETPAATLDAFPGLLRTGRRFRAVGWIDRDLLIDEAGNDLRVLRPGVERAVTVLMSEHGPCEDPDRQRALYRAQVIADVDRALIAARGLADRWAMR